MVIGPKSEQYFCYNQPMTERLPKAEKSNVLWVPFRSKSQAQPHMSQYGNVSWNPNFIPEGNRLEIEVNGINRLLKLSNIGFPLEIWSYNEPKKDDFTVRSRVNQVNQAASLALESFAYRSRKPLNLADFYYDEIGEKGILRVNFTGIAERLEQKYQNGPKDPQFYVEYGKLVDRAIKSQMGYIINTNTAIFCRDHEEIYYGEGKAVLIGLVPLAGGSLFALLQMIVNPADYQNALKNLEIGIGGFEGFYILITGLQLLGLLKDVNGQNEESTRYRQYLINKLIKGNLDEKIQVMIPYNTARYLLLPYSVNVAWSKNLVRGK